MATALAVMGGAPPRRALAARLEPLDGLRGFAILLVYFYHYTAGGIRSGSPLIRGVSLIAGFGWSGVDLFFVLSGFLITGILLETRKRQHYFRNFYARRILRIFPIYYLFAGIALLVVPFAEWRTGDLLFLVYLGYPAANIWPSIIQISLPVTHLWSLSVEEQFYLLWPGLIRRLPSQRAILWLCGLLMAAAPLLRVLLPGWAYNSLPCRVDDLALGAALAILFRGKVWGSCQRWAWPVFFIALGLLAAVFAKAHTADRGNRLVLTAGLTVIAFLYGALLILGLGPLQRFFSQSPLRMFGRYSYGLYLYHFPMEIVWGRLKPVFLGMPAGAGIYFAVCLAGNLGIAMLSFYFLEQPVLRLKHRFES